MTDALKRTQRAGWVVGESGEAGEGRRSANRYGVCGACAAGEIASLLPERSRRADSRCPARRYVTGGNGRGNQHARRHAHRQRIFRRHSKQERLHQMRCAVCQRKSDRKPGGGEYQDLPRITSQTTLPLCAPKAMRIPISPVRRATVYAMVPYNPTAAMSSARTAKALHSLAKMRSC